MEQNYQLYPHLSTDYLPWFTLSRWIHKPRAVTVEPSWTALALVGSLQAHGGVDGPQRAGFRDWGTRGAVVTLRTSLTGAVVSGGSCV